MHDTAYISVMLFAKYYGAIGKRVLDIGGKDVNGSLRKHFVERGMEYISVDIEPHPSVDVVIKPNEKLPFNTSSIDLIVSTSCFEHDPCFWMTFKEMTRVVKMGGFIYVNAPANGKYHCHPGDNWRFFADAGQALSYWSGYQISNEDVYPVKVIETFNILPKGDIWIDFVCVWQRIEEKQTEIILPTNIVQQNGPLEKLLNEKGFHTKKNVSTR